MDVEHAYQELVNVYGLGEPTVLARNACPVLLRRFDTTNHYIIEIVWPRCDTSDDSAIYDNELLGLYSFLTKLGPDRQSIELFVSLGLLSAIPNGNKECGSIYEWVILYRK